MSIKSETIKTLVDKKYFTRKDIYKAIYKAQGIKEIPSKFPSGFYGTNINHWVRDGLIERVEKNKYKRGVHAKLYLSNPTEYRKKRKKDKEMRIIASNQRRKEFESMTKFQQWKHRYPSSLEQPSEDSQAYADFGYLEGKTIRNVRRMSDEEAQNFGWYSKPIILEFEDGTILLPSKDDEFNDGGAMYFADYNSKDNDCLYVTNR